MNRKKILRVCFFCRKLARKLSSLRYTKPHSDVENVYRYILSLLEHAPNKAAGGGLAAATIIELTGAADPLMAESARRTVPWLSE